MKLSRTSNLSCASTPSIHLLHRVPHLLCHPRPLHLADTDASHPEAPRPTSHPLSTDPVPLLPSNRPTFPSHPLNHHHLPLHPARHMRNAQSRKPTHRHTNLHYHAPLRQIHSNTKTNAHPKNQDSSVDSFDQIEDDVHDSKKRKKLWLHYHGRRSEQGSILVVSVVMDITRHFDTFYIYKFFVA